MISSRLPVTAHRAPVAALSSAFVMLRKAKKRRIAHARRLIREHAYSLPWETTRERSRSLATSTSSSSSPSEGTSAFAPEAAMLQTKKKQCMDTSLPPPAAAPLRSLAPKVEVPVPHAPGESRAQSMDYSEVTGAPVS